jgi:nucleoside-diphosphate-sugar epimerase
MRRTLILGCGYLGCRVGTRLVEQGDVVFGTTRNEAKGDGLQRLGITPVVMDVADPSPLAALPPVERVVHSLGFDRKAGASRSEVVIGGLNRVLDALESVSRILFTSTTGVHGQEDGSWIDETSPTSPTDEPGRIALEAENLLRDRRPDAVIVRLAGLYGPGRMIRRDLLLAGAPIVGAVDSYLNLIHIDDAAAVVVAALEHAPAGSTYLACDDRPLVRREYYRTMAEFLQAPEPRFEPGEGTRRERTNRRISNRKIREELGVRLLYPDVREGLAASLRDEAE